MNERVALSPNNLEAFWMPFSANRQFKKAPRMFVGAKDMHYTTSDGRQVLDGTAGLWCVARREGVPGASVGYQTLRSVRMRARSSSRTLSDIPKR